MRARFSAGDATHFAAHWAVNHFDAKLSRHRACSNFRLRSGEEEMFDKYKFLCSIFSER
jgi:hypothetical protein